MTESVGIVNGKYETPLNGATNYFLKPTCVRIKHYGAPQFMHFLGFNPCT